MVTISSSLMRRFLLADDGQRLARRPLLFPARQYQAHAMHALDRAQQVDAAGKGPPAIAGGFDEMPALQPAFMGAGRRVTAEAAALDLEAQQLQPVLEARTDR
jgi:hypothetical protein